MNDIVTERSGSILRIQLNRPTRKNAMYVGLADRAGPGALNDGNSNGAEVGRPAVRCDSGLQTADASVLPRAN